MLIPICIYFLCSCFAALIVLSACAAAGSNLSANLFRPIIGKRRSGGDYETDPYVHVQNNSSAALNPFSAPRSPRGAVGRSALSRSAGSGPPLSPDPAKNFGRLLALSQSWRRVA